MDRELVRQMKYNFKKFKNVKDLKKRITIPETLKDTTDQSFMFYSRFESGNLLKVVEVPVDLPNNPTVDVSCDLVNLPVVAEYNLYLEQDTTTNGHMHWYYF